MDGHLQDVALLCLIVWCWGRIGGEPPHRAALTWTHTIHIYIHIYTYTYVRTHQGPHFQLTAPLRRALHRAAVTLKESCGRNGGMVRKERTRRKKGRARIHTWRCKWSVDGWGWGCTCIPPSPTLHTHTHIITQSPLPTPSHHTHTHTHKHINTRTLRLLSPVALHPRGQVQEGHEIVAVRP
jgi:hypothetical protein